MKVYTGQRPVWLHCGWLLQPTCFVLVSRSVQALDTIARYSYTDTCFFLLHLGSLCRSVQFLPNGMPSCTWLSWRTQRVRRKWHQSTDLTSHQKWCPKTLNFNTGQMTVSITWLWLAWSRWLVGRETVWSMNRLRSETVLSRPMNSSVKGER